MHLLDPWAFAWACPEWCPIHLALLELAVDWHGFAELQAWYLELALYLSWFRSWRRSLALSWGGPWPRLPGCPAGVHVVCDDWTDSPPYWNYPYALCLDILSANLLRQSICLLLAWNYLSISLCNFDWYLENKNSVNYLFAFLHNRQQTTTSTHNTKHITFIDQNAICNGDSGSHQN